MKKCGTERKWRVRHFSLTHNIPPKIVLQRFGNSPTFYFYRRTTCSHFISKTYFSTEISTGAPITFLSREFHCINNKRTATAQRHWHTHTYTRATCKEVAQIPLELTLSRYWKYGDVFVKSTVIFIIKLNKHHTWIYFYLELMPFYSAFSCLMIVFLIGTKKKTLPGPKHMIDILWSGFPASSLNIT